MQTIVLPDDVILQRGGWTNLHGWAISTPKLHSCSWVKVGPEKSPMGEEKENILDIVGFWHRVRVSLCTFLNVQVKKYGPRSLGKENKWQYFLFISDLLEI
jgi:hypothetical protein